MGQRDEPSTATGAGREVSVPDSDPGADSDERAGGAVPETVALPESLLARYRRFSLYNSPYPAHDAGCAIDLYPGTLRDGRTTAAPSPVAGTVLETRTVRAPPKPYAVEHDHLILIECDGPSPLAGLVARILHVEPSVAAGDRVEPGDSLGDLVRVGFFAPWVDNHLHVGVRRPDQHLHRATGSLPLEPGVDVDPLEWDGTGRVVATGETYAVLDAPAHPDPGERFVGIATGEGGVVDGGVPHYDGGGVHRAANGSSRCAARENAAVHLLGTRLGTIEADGRTVAWDALEVTANGESVTGLSAFCARDDGFGAKLVCPDHDLAVGELVTVEIRSQSSDA